MIRIEDDTTGSIYLTLREKSTNVNPNYTFKIIHKESLYEYTFCAENFSNSVYWDAFTISIGTGSATAGYVDCNYGEYTYEVYETTNKYDLGLTSSLGLIETGIFIINPTYSEVKSVEYIPKMKINTNLDRI